MTPDDAATVKQARELLEAWDGVALVLMLWSKQCGAMAEELFSGYASDDFVRGMMVGEGYAWDRASRAFDHVHNAMELIKEAADRGVRDE